MTGTDSSEEPEAEITIVDLPVIEVEAVTDETPVARTIELAVDGDPERRLVV